MAYEIEKDIKLSGNTNRRKRFPFDQMEVGNSFFAPWPEAQQARGQALSRNAGQYKNPPRYGSQQRFVTRRIRCADSKCSGTCGDCGMRIWRVE